MLLHYFRQFDNPLGTLKPLDNDKNVSPPSWLFSLSPGDASLSPDSSIILESLESAS